MLWSRREALRDHCQRVSQAAQRARVQLRFRIQLLSGLFQHPKARDEVSTIGSRYVLGRQRLQSSGVVPVEKVAFAAFQLLPAFRPSRCIAPPSAPGVRNPKSRAETADISHIPMFVGEVRSATSMRKASCELSGGSQLCSGPTRSSKKRQVSRATRRRKSWSSTSTCSSFRTARRCYPIQC